MCELARDDLLTFLGDPRAKNFKHPAALWKSFWLFFLLSSFLLRSEETKLHWEVTSSRYYRTNWKLPIRIFRKHKFSTIASKCFTFYNLGDKFHQAFCKWLINNICIVLLQQDGFRCLNKLSNFFVLSKSFFRSRWSFLWLQKISCT